LISSFIFGWTSFNRVPGLKKIFYPVKQTITISPSPEITATPTASPSATPTPKPLTFQEMNQLYGPCVNLPVLMYHHIEPAEKAKKEKRTGLNVDPDIFRSQMEYLKMNGYTTILPISLINFFENGSVLPKKPVMITFDDGYEDNGAIAYPILQEFGFKGVIFIPTGLMENNNYLTWEKIREMAGSGLIYFGNHTWSHINVGGNHDVVKKEITTGDLQLKERGLNTDKVFAYPYGVKNGFSQDLLKEQGYKLAFTTVNGRIMCSKQRFLLPRVRIGASSLKNFGL